jgi:hypothetical protein
MHPYIGITDFMDFAQVRRMLQVFNAHKPEGSLQMLHVGVMMSYKTLHGIPSKWQDVFPAKEMIADIFGCDEAYNCLHYADYEGHADLWKDLAIAISFGGTGIHALQLDMIWPDPNQIRRGVRASRKQIEVILQIGKDALEVLSNDPDAVLEQLADYEGIVQRVLLDKSMGMGVSMKADELLPFVRAIKKAFPAFGVGVAGGLGPGTVRLAEPLIKEFPDLSRDAQGRLRPSRSALDPIDWDMAATYLIEAFSL